LRQEALARGEEPPTPHARVTYFWTPTIWWEPEIF
jgi:hypothetical protein